MDDDLEERIRDLRRRIKEARDRLFSPRPSIIETIEKMVEQGSSLGETSKEKRDAELNDIRNKLRRKS